MKINSEEKEGSSSHCPTTKSPRVQTSGELLTDRLFHCNYFNLWNLVYTAKWKTYNNSKRIENTDQSI